MKKIKRKIFVCCTEQSGDNISANILNKINNRNDYLIDGVGGFKTKKYLRKKYFDVSDFKSIGIAEVLFSIFIYLNIIKYLAKIIINNNYDLVITIDSPDFNYQLAKKLRKNKFKNRIIHIVSPSVWAWRKGRAKKFSIIYDEIFTLFKFENKYFNKYGLKTTFIGHPIFHILTPKNNIKNKKYISFLFGSRENEINKLFYYFDIAHNILLKNKSKKYIIFIPTLPHLKKLIQKKTKNWKLKKIIETNPTKINTYFKNVEISLTCSGTASLEIAKRLIPQLIIYKLNFITTIIGFFLIKIKFANLINIFSNQMIIPELVNFNLTKNKFIEEFELLVNDKKRNNNQIKKIKTYLKTFQNKKSPYVICSERIKKIV